MLPKDDYDDDELAATQVLFYYAAATLAFLLSIVVVAVWVVALVLLSRERSELAGVKSDPCTASVLFVDEYGCTLKIKYDTENRFKRKAIYPAEEQFPKPSKKAISELCGSQGDVFNTTCYRVHPVRPEHEYGTTVTPPTVRRDLMIFVTVTTIVVVLEFAAVFLCVCSGYIGARIGHVSMDQRKLLRPKRTEIYAVQTYTRKQLRTKTQANVPPTPAPVGDVFFDAASQLDSEAATPSGTKPFLTEEEKEGEGALAAAAYDRVWDLAFDQLRVIVGAAVDDELVSEGDLLRVTDSVVCGLSGLVVVNAALRTVHAGVGNGVLMSDGGVISDINRPRFGEATDIYFKMVHLVQTIYASRATPADVKLLKSRVFVFIRPGDLDDLPASGYTGYARERLKHAEAIVADIVAEVLPLPRFKQNFARVLVDCINEMSLNGEDRYGDLPNLGRRGSGVGSVTRPVNVSVPKGKKGKGAKLAPLVEDSTSSSTGPEPQRRKESSSSSSSSSSTSFTS